MMSKQIGIIERVSKVLLLALALSVAGCATHSSSTPAPTGGPVPVGTTPIAISPTQILTYRLAVTADQQAKADPNDLVACPIPLPSGNKDPATVAIESLTKGSGSPLPPGTELESINIDAATKIATVDFSKEFKTNFAGGDTREAQALNSVLATMGQFPSVTKVQFLVNGKKIDSLGGTQDLTEPLPTPQGSQKVAAGGA